MEQKTSVPSASLEKTERDSSAERDRLVLVAHQIIIYKAKVEELTEQIGNMVGARGYYKERIEQAQQEMKDLQDGQILMEI